MKSIIIFRWPPSKTNRSRRITQSDHQKMCTLTLSVGIRSQLVEVLAAHVLNGACAFPQGLDVTKNLEYLQRDGVCMLRWCSTIRRGEDRSGNDIIGPKDRCNQSSSESRDSLYVVMECIIINSSYSVLKLLLICCTISWP